MALARVSQTRSKQATPAKTAKRRSKPKSTRVQRKVNTWSGFEGISWQSLVTPPLTTIPTIQPKLKIGEPNDKFEQEADRVADEVMQMPDREVVGAAASQPPTENTSTSVQRMCDECAEEEKGTLRRKPIQNIANPLPISGLNGAVAAGFQWTKQTAPIQRQEMEYEEEETLQTKRATSGTPEMTPGIEAGIQSLQVGGRPLPPSVRTFFEPRFGHDFSQVRIHTDAQAAASAHAVNARAFTVGNDIVFARDSTS